HDAFFPAVSGVANAARFYTGAWLLVHLLRGGPDAYRRRFDTFAAGLNAGEAAGVAWREATAGLSPGQLELDFRTHMEASSWPRFGATVTLAPATHMTERRMTAAEVHLLWA